MQIKIESFRALNKPKPAYAYAQHRVTNSIVCMIEITVLSLISLCTTQTLQNELVWAESQQSAVIHSSSVFNGEKQADLEQKVRKTVSVLLNKAPNAKISSRPDRIGPALALNLDLSLDGESAQQRAENFIHRYAGLWGNVSVHVEHIESRRGRDVAHLVGKIGEIPLLNQQSKLSLKGDRAQHLSNGMGAIYHMVKANIDEEGAKNSAFKTLRDRMLTPISVKRGAISHEPGVAYEVFEVRLAQPTQLKTWVVLIDGRDGAVLRVSEGEKR